LFPVPQLAQKLNQSANGGSSKTSSSADALSRAEEGNTSAIDDEEKALKMELDRLIGRLSDLISGRLTAAASTSSQNAAVKRFREILLDLRSDYDKSQGNVRRARERRELLGGNNGRSGSGNENDPAMDHLLRERNHITNSLNVASDVIGQADSVRQDLYGQGRSLRSTGALMQQIAGNVPGLNHLVDAIRRRRSRDDKIVAAVIASCVVFTLWYLFG